MSSLNPSDFIKSMLGVGNKSTNSDQSLQYLNKKEENLTEMDQTLLEMDGTSSSSSSISIEEKNNESIVLNGTKQEIQFLADEICRETTVHSSNVVFAIKEDSESLETQNITHSIIAASDWGKTMPQCELITVHKNNKFIAYVINGNTASGRKSSVVRIQNMGLGQISLSCFHELVLELEFAWVDDLLLAVIDQSASLFIFSILNPSSDQFESKLQIRINVDSTQVIEYQRLVWIKYISLDQEDHLPENIQLYLAQSRNNEAVIWNINDVIQKKTVELVHYNDIKSQCFIIEPHPMSILDMKLSPDGTTVATTCLDGVVRFYEVNFHEKESLACVFQWTPHNSAPVNFISFLDDHLQEDANFCKFWEFVVTCSSNLNEFKLSNCASWTCIQTISIYPLSTTNDIKSISFKMIVHPGSMGIALLDAKNKSIFLLKRKKESKRLTYISSCYRILFKTPCLSMAFENNSTKNLDEDFNNISFYTQHPKVLEKINLNVLRFDEDIVSRHQGLGDTEFNKDNVFLKSGVNLISPFTFHDQNYLLPTTEKSINKSINGKDLSLDRDDVILCENKHIVNLNDSTDLLSKSGRENVKVLNVSNNLYNNNSLLNMFTNFGIVNNCQEKNILVDKSNINEVNYNSESLNVNNANNQFQSIKRNLMDTPSENLVNFGGNDQKSNLNDLVNVSVQIQNIPANYTNIYAHMPSSLTNILQQLESHGKILDQLNLQQKYDQLDVRIKHIENMIENNMNNPIDDISSQLKNLFFEREEYLAQKMTEFIGELEERLINKMELEINSVTANTLTSTISPVIIKNMNDLTTRLEQDFRHRITSSDVLIKESIKDCFKSKQLTDELAKSICNNVELVLKEILLKNFLPTFNNGCQNMVQQVQAAYNKGIISYMNKLNENSDLTIAKLNTSNKAKDATNLQFKNLIEFIEKFSNKNTIDKDLKELTYIVQKAFEHISIEKLNMDQHIEKLSQSLLTNMQNIIQSTIHSILSDYEAKLSSDINTTIQSRVSTPVPIPNQSTKITDKNTLKFLVQNEKYNDAFKMALSLMDLEIVIYTCNLVDNRKLLAKSIYSLEQPVLYSLIQQLSADLLDNADLKSRFLEESLLAIDNENELMLSHLQSVINQVCTNAKLAYQSTMINTKARSSIKNLINLAETILEAQL